jgi:hypothetical protein
MDNGEFELAGVLKLGRQVSQIKENTNEGLGDTRALLATVQNGDVSTSRIVEDIEAKIGKVERNLDREVRQIRSAETDVPVRSKSVQQFIRAEELANGKALATAQAQERIGFEALLKRDVAAARRAFDAAFASYPEYHNVTEVRVILESEQVAPANPQSAEWDRLHQRILTTLSWGMPAELRPRFRSLVTKSYR